MMANISPYSIGYRDALALPQNILSGPPRTKQNFLVAGGEAFIQGVQQEDTLPELSGYLRSLGKAYDDYNGGVLEYMLDNRKIAIDYLPPFSTLIEKTGYTSHGVVKINNIPFTVSAQEVVQFINRYSTTPMIKKNLDGYPIHIIMEKPTGKTMDCFVEFPHAQAARECIARFEYTAHPGRGSKLGTRNVTLDLSNQAELMQAVFPRARLVKFDSETGRPTIYGPETDTSWSDGFRGYFTLEEIYGVTRFAENPSRSPFVLKCHQRVYECMISTLYKFPWAATRTYTVTARNALFEAVFKQLSILARKVGSAPGPTMDKTCMPYSYHPSAYGYSKPLTMDDEYEPVQLTNREVGLNQVLLVDLLFAAVNVPCFTLVQKSALCQAAGSFGRGIQLSPFGEHWPFQTLEPTSSAEDPTIKFWLELFDTGFDIMTTARIPTTFEDYIVFSRNSVGFPIGEWTKKGADLNFAEATQVEQAVVMHYINQGREAWAQERQVEVSSWPNTTLVDLQRKIFGEQEAARLLVKAEQKRLDYLDDEVSPKSSGAWTKADTSPVRRSESNAGGVDKSSPGGTAMAKSKLNAATAADFVPAFKQHADASKSDLPPHRFDYGRLNINAGRANAGSGTAFRNPFAHTRQERSQTGWPDNDASTYDRSFDPEALQTARPSYEIQPADIAHSDAEHLVNANVVEEPFSKLSMTSTVKPDRQTTPQNQISGEVDSDNRSLSSGVLLEGSTILSPEDGSIAWSTPQRHRTLPDLAHDQLDPTPVITQDFGPVGSARGSVANTQDPFAQVDKDKYIDRLRAQSIPFARTDRSTVQGAGDDRDYRFRSHATQVVE